jgi:ribonuclease BN (tRNA processing enzyme)
MRLTVLGKSPSWQDAGGACSGYLVQEGETAILIDCGNGVFGKLRERVDYVEVDAVLLSHLHADHFLDLVPFAYALTYAPRQQPVPVDGWPGTDSPARPELHAPQGARETFRRVVGAWGNEDLIEKAFHLREYRESDELAVGPVTVSLQGVPHFTDTYAMRLSSSNGAGSLVYGADCRPTEALTDFASGSELMLIEATLPRPERTGERGHLTPREAGEHGRAAGVRRLVLTHISDELDAEWAREEAASAFQGPVEVARHGAIYEVP